jgi:hypothetical protein
MKPLYLLTILLVAANTCIYSQQMPPFIEWQKSLGGSGNDMGNAIINISNSASIYFDYNLPVRTNTQMTILKPEPPPSPVVTGLLTNYCSSSGVQKVQSV